MNEIKLQVDEKNIKTVLHILENLKEGLIENIEAKQAKRKHTAYQPKTKTIIKEQTPALATQSGKYVNPAAYKERLKKR